MRFVAIAAVLAAALLPSAAIAEKAKGIQCWTDKNGQRMCGDRVPPEYAGQKRDVFKDGRVIDTISATKSAEEQEAEKRRQKEAEEHQKAAEYDRALLESYRSPSDITSTRDERLSLIDSRMQAAEKNASDNDKSLTSLRTRAEQQTAAGKPVDEKLAKQIRQFEKSQAANDKALERYRNEREALLAKFAKDYVRYSELRGLPVTEPPPPKGQVAEGEKAGETKAAPAASTAPSAPAAQGAPPKAGG